MSILKWRDCIPCSSFRIYKDWTKRKVENWNKSRTILAKLKTIQEPITITHLGDIYVDNNRVLRPKLVERNEVHDEREREVDHSTHILPKRPFLIQRLITLTQTKNKTHTHARAMNVFHLNIHKIGSFTV